MRIQPRMIALGLMLALIAVFIVFTWIMPFLAQDSCLDRGGSWNAGECEFAERSPAFLTVERS